MSYPPGGVLGPRWQRDVQLVLVHSGSATIFVDDAPPAVHDAGEAALLVPGHWERFEFDRHVATHHSWIQLGADEPVPDAIVQAPRALKASIALTELVRNAAEVARTPLSTRDPLLAALAAASIWRYVGDAESSAEDAADPVERARGFLHVNLDDTELDLARLADSVHVTPAHLVRRFKAELGVTPMAYLWQRRVATGVSLLTDTGLPVGEVARRSGFKSVYHFSRRVKHATGLPPTELRRRGWSQTSPPAE